MADTAGARAGHGSSSASAEAENLSRALVALGAPAAPAAAVEWMFAYPGAHPLLHLLCTTLGPDCALSAAEAAARATLPPADAHVLARALPAVRGARAPATTRAATAKTRLRLLEAQRDALRPLVRKSEQAAEAAFAATLRGGDGEARAPPTAPAALRARAARARLAALLPLAPTAPATRGARAAAEQERRVLAGALLTAKRERARGRDDAARDARAAQAALAKFAPLFAAAARRRARRAAVANSEAQEQAAAASREAADIVTREVASRTRRRQRDAVDVTSRAIELAAKQRVRLEVLLRALSAKREVHALLNEFLRAAAAAKPPGTDGAEDGAGHDGDVAPEKENGDERVEEILASAEKQIAELWGVDMDDEMDIGAEMLQAKIDQLSGPMKEMLAQAAAHAELPSTESAVRALEGVERAVAQNGAALETLLRERRSRLAVSAPSGSTSSASYVDGDDAMQSLEYAALVEFHVGNRNGANSGAFSNVSGIGSAVPSSRSMRSGRSERSAGSSAMGYGAG